MKILVYAYLNNNFGDDLFLDILFNRYPKISFTVLNSNNCHSDNLKNYKNVKIYKINTIHKLVNLLGEKLYQKNIYYDYLSKKFDMFILIGGSMFIESEKWEKRFKQCVSLSQHCSRCCVIGANFGPYKSENFRDCYKKWFSKLAFVSFRDKFSYKQFADLPHVQYASDIVFSYIKKTSIKNSDEFQSDVLISVCNFKIHDQVSKWFDSYVFALQNLCQEQVLKKKKIILMSMCPSEGDNEVISMIKSNLPHDILSGVKEIEYKNNIEEIIKYFEYTKCVIATRFHSMILGLLFDKPITPIIYSAKLRNVLIDISYPYAIYEMSHINELVINEKKFCCSNDYKKKAQDHFKYLDLIYAQIENLV